MPHERERISSQAVVGRLRDGQHRGRGERGVDRIASLGERRQTGCRGERMARRDHRPADDRRHPAPPAGSRGPGTEQGGKVELHPRILAVSPASIPCHHGGVNLKRPRTPHYDDPVAVGRRLHAAREAAGISQRDLAFPGCSAAYISRIERGERVPVTPGDAGARAPDRHQRVGARVRKGAASTPPCRTRSTRSKRPRSPATATSSQRPTARCHGRRRTRPRALS